MAHQKITPGIEPLTLFSCRLKKTLQIFRLFRYAYWRLKKTLQIFRLFRYAYPSSSLRCSRKRPSLLYLACASGRLSFAVGERYYCVYFLSAISFHVRTYADASFHITIQARSTNTINDGANNLEQGRGCKSGRYLHCRREGCLSFSRMVADPGGFI